MHNHMKSALITCVICCTTAYSATVGLYFENDVVFHTDNNYSHGTQLKYTANKPLWLFDDVGISVMQMMYTPDNIKQTEIQYGDRPYCGMLGVNLQGRVFNRHHIDDVQLTLGTIGPRSYADDTQRIVHKLIKSSTPRGWPHQLSNEPIINVEIRRTYMISQKLARNLYVGCQPGADIQVGNWNNAAEAFIDFYIGDAAKKIHDYGITQRDLGIGDKMHMWLMCGVAGKHVWHSTQLDGNVFRHSEYHVDSEEWVAEVRYGVILAISDITLQIIQIHRTREYTTQKSAHSFGTFLLSYTF